MTKRAPSGGYVVLAGGVGAARLLRGMVLAVDPSSITAIVNTGDDVTLHGLHVSPDLDTITYTLAGEDNTETGWGLKGETWQAMDMVGRYGGIDWFNLGDRDLGTHLYRTQRLSEGAALSTVTAEITAAWGIEASIVPVSDDPIETRVTVEDEGEIGFQEYFVRRRHDVAVRGLRIVGADVATPAPGVIEAIERADHIIIAPSNPIVSIGPLLAVPPVAKAIAARRDDVTAVSPIVAGKALKGPADRLMSDFGIEPSVVGIADLYREIASTLVIDDQDSARRGDVESAGVDCIPTDTIMATADIAAALCRTILDNAS